MIMEAVPCLYRNKIEESLEAIPTFFTVDAHTKYNTFQQLLLID